VARSRIASRSRIVLRVSVCVEPFIYEEFTGPGIVYRGPGHTEYRGPGQPNYAKITRRDRVPSGKTKLEQKSEQKNLHLDL